MDLHDQNFQKCMDKAYDYENMCLPIKLTREQNIFCKMIKNREKITIQQPLTVIINIINH